MMNDTPVGKFLKRLNGVRQTAPGRWIACCPAHDDRRPSLSIRETDDGRALLHCFASCNAADVVAAAGLTLADLFPDEPRRHRVQGQRPHVPAADVLRLIWHEGNIVLAAAYTIARGELTVDDLARLEVAVERLTDAMRIAGARP